MARRESGVGVTVIRGLVVGLCLFFMALPAAAVDKGKAKYIAGTLVGVAPDTTALIRLDDGERLVFVPKGGRVEIPWTAIDKVEYRGAGMEGRSRTALAVLTPYSLLFTKGKRRYVTLAFKDGRDAEQVAVFEFDKQEIALTLATIQQRTGQRISCEGEDVRRPIPACSVPDPVRVLETTAAHQVAPVSASLPPRLAGPRVRIMAPSLSAGPIQGELISSDENALTIRTTSDSVIDRRYGNTVSVPRESVTRFERSVRPSRKFAGAAIGTLVGVAVGFAVLRESLNGGEGGQSGVGLFAIPGALMGYAAAPGEKWTEENPKRVHADAGRAGGRGVRLSLSFRF